MDPPDIPPWAEDIGCCMRVYMRAGLEVFPEAKYRRVQPSTNNKHKLTCVHKEGLLLDAKVGVTYNNKIPLEPVGRLWVM